MAIVSETRETGKERRERIEKEKRKSLDWINSAMHRHLNSEIDERWSGYSWTHALVFTDAARVRLGSIFGWILAVASQDENFAIQAAEDICKQLDYLRDYGGHNDAADGREVSNYRIQLHCDGTLHGFGVCWFALVASDYTGDGVSDELTRDDVQRSRYRFSWNGGLLYHGPGGAEVFAVSLDSSLWSIHT